MAKRTAGTALGPLEGRVMDVLWRTGPSTVADVRVAVNAGAGEALAYSTVMTVLVRLHAKGFVGRSAEGRRYRYAAASDRSSFPELAGRIELQRLIDRHGLDAVAGFAADLSGADGQLVRRLRALADEETA